jgi:hypothetical protein
VVADIQNSEKPSNLFTNPESEGCAVVKISAIGYNTLEAFEFVFDI